MTFIDNILAKINKSNIESKQPTPQQSANNNQTQESVVAIDYSSVQEYEDISYDPFEVYQQMRKELYGEEISDSYEEDFDKLLRGEEKTNDILANSIIEASREDIYENELSKTEFDELIKKISNGEIKGIDIDELQDNDTQVEDLYQAQMDEIAQKYLSKLAQDCTEEELNQAYALNLVEGILLSSQAGLENQDDSDGIISEIFDWLKEKTGLGTCQEDVENALKTQEEIVSKLKSAIRDGSFETVWKELTGVEYDPEKIAQYQQKNAELSFVSLSIEKVSNLYQELANNENMYDVENTYDTYINFYGTEKGEKEFLETLKYGYNNTMDSGLYDPSNPITDIKFDKDKNLIFTMQDGSSFNLGGLENINPNSLTPTYSDKFKNSKIEEHIKEIKETTGLDYIELTKECNDLSKATLGNANAVSNILNEYINSQEGFIDVIGGFTQIAGMGTMIAGAGIACFIPGGQGIGLAMAKAGQAMAVMGTFGDEALEVADKLTNEKTFEEDLEEYKEILKEFLTDGALFASGYTIGKGANALGDLVLSETGNKLLSKFADIGMDATLSLLTDAAITGDLDLSGEFVSQFFGILTGSAFARINAANTKMVNSATDIYNKNGLDSAVDFLKNQGASNKTIENFKTNTQIQKLNAEIEEGRLTSQEAAEQLEAQGIDKKLLINFKKSHGLEYRSQAQIMSDLIKKKSIDGVFAKEATLDYNLGEADAIRYAQYRKSGMSADIALENVLYDNLSLSEKADNLEFLGLNRQEAELYAKNMTFFEHNYITKFYIADNDTKMQYLRELGVTSEYMLPEYAKKLDGIEKISAFTRLLSYGFEAHKAFDLLPVDAKTTKLYNDTLNFAQMSTNAKTAELERLGLNNQDAKNFAQNFSCADYMNMHTLLGYGHTPKDAAYYGKHIPSVMQIDLAHILKTKKDALDRLINIGITGETLSKLSENSRFGELLQNISEEQLTRLEKIAKDPKKLQLFKIAATNQYALGSASGVENISKYYDDFNYILYGEPVDTKLTSSLDEIGKKYGISIKAENNIGLIGNYDAPRVINEDFLKSIDEALAELKAKGIKIPKEIYISSFDTNTSAAGVFSTSNPNAITLNAVAFSNKGWIEAVVMHETAHMNDWDKIRYKSFNNALKAGIVQDKTQPLNKDITFKGKTITPDDIAGLIRGYATTNIVEFKAEVDALLAYGAIIKGADGKYIIDENNIPPGYCTAWTNSDADKKKLANIMELYNYLIS